jgi:hypothetical protein
MVLPSCFPLKTVPDKIVVPKYSFARGIFPCEIAFLILVELIEGH